MGKIVDTITTTTGGVLAANDPTGTVQIDLGRGDTIARMVAIDGDGNTSMVFLDYRQVVELMTSLGACAHNM